MLGKVSGINSGVEYLTAIQTEGRCVVKYIRMGGQLKVCMKGREDVAQRPCANVSLVRGLSECGMSDRARLPPSRVRGTLSHNFLHSLLPVYWRWTL